MSAPYGRHHGRGPVVAGQSRRVFIAATLAAVMASGGAFAQEARRPMRLLCLGDSLTAGYMLPAGQGFVPVLEKALKARGLDVECIDAGVSGDTAVGARDRVAWALGEGADAAIVELGANDMFRGADPAQVKAALDDIIRQLKENNVRILLAGMRASPALGADYAARFDAIYPDLARAHDIALYPFFLEGVAADRTLKLSDGIHPSKAGIERIVANILPAVVALLGQE